MNKPTTESSNEQKKKKILNERGNDSMLPISHFQLKCGFESHADEEKSGERSNEKYEIKRGRK